MFIYHSIINNNLELITSIALLISLLCGVFVIISKNPIVSVLFLIGLFSSIAVYLIILGISFVGLSYLLVYVGAISILFLFILMLINIRISELLSETSRSVPLAIFVSIVFNYSMIQLLPFSLLNIKEFNITNIYDSYKYKMLNQLNDIKKTYFITTNNWDSNMTEISDITSIGNIIYTSYSVWLIIASIILLLAMVGAIVITRKQVDTVKYMDNNKWYSTVVKADIKALLAIYTGSLTLYDNNNNIKLGSNNLSTNNKPNINIDLVNKTNIEPKINIDIHSHPINIYPNLDPVNIEPKVNINLINKINEEPKINLDFISQYTVKSFNLESKVSYLPSNKIPLYDLSIDYIYNNVYLPFNYILTCCPQYLILPIIIILLPIVLPVTNPNNTDTNRNESNVQTDKGESSTTLSGIKITEAVSHNANISGSNGGEDPNQNRKKIFFLLKDKKKIPVPYNLYKEYIDNLEIFLKVRTSLKEKLHSLRSKISNYITGGGKLNLCNPETGEINEAMENFLEYTEDDRKEIIKLINEYTLWQIGLQESMDKITNIDSEINDNFNTSIELINIGVHEMGYYSLDNDLYNIIEENIGIIFSIIDISPYASNFNMAYNPSTGSAPINVTTPIDPSTFDTASSLNDMAAFSDASQLIFDTNLDSEILYEYNTNNWEVDSDLYNDDTSDIEYKGKEIRKGEDES
jgi:NADH-ubiquinone oxidoreductase chain 6